MYRASGDTDSLTLANQGKGPDLACTESFWALIETLPDHCKIPAQIIRLGVLSRHLEPEPDQFEIKPEAINVDLASTAVVPPQTLAKVRWLLSNHTDHLSKSEKERIGELCSSSKLNQPPVKGEFDAKIIQSESRVDIEESAFLKKRSRNVTCEHCGAEYESTAALNGHLANCDEGQSKEETRKSVLIGQYRCVYVYTNQYHIVESGKVLYDYNGGLCHMALLKSSSLEIYLRESTVHSTCLLIAERSIRSDRCSEYRVEFRARMWHKSISIRKGGERLAHRLGGWLRTQTETATSHFHSHTAGVTENLC